MKIERNRTRVGRVVGYVRHFGLHVFANAIGQGPPTYGETTRRQRLFSSSFSFVFSFSIFFFIFHQRNGPVPHTGVRISAEESIPRFPLVGKHRPMMTSSKINGQPNGTRKRRNKPHGVGNSPSLPSLPSFTEFFFERCAVASFFLFFFDFFGVFGFFGFFFKVRPSRIAKTRTNKKKTKESRRRRRRRLPKGNEQERRRRR